MIKEIKLEEKELKEIKEIRQENSRMTVDFGRLRLDIIMVKARLMELEKMDSDTESRFKGNQTKERKISEKLKKKYGDGSINLDKGVFTPIEEKNG